MAESKKQSTKRKRRWLRFSLRTFLIGITLLCAWLAWVVYRVERQRETIRWIEENGGSATYGYQVEIDGVVIRNRVIHGSEPCGPAWFRELAGLDYLENVTMVVVNVDDINRLGHLRNLQHLDLRSSNIEDISVLSTLTELEVLVLNHTHISDISPLKHLTNLVALELDNTQIKELTHLYGLTNLEVLKIRNTSISKEEVRRFKEALPNCRVFY